MALMGLSDACFTPPALYRCFLSYISGTLLLGCLSAPLATAQLLYHCIALIKFLKNPQNQ